MTFSKKKKQSAEFYCNIYGRSVDIIYVYNKLKCNFIIDVNWSNKLKCYCLYN